MSELTLESPSYRPSSIVHKPLLALLSLVRLRGACVRVCVCEIHTMRVCTLVDACWLQWAGGGATPTDLREQPTGPELSPSPFPPVPRGRRAAREQGATAWSAGVHLGLDMQAWLCRVRLNCFKVLSSPLQRSCKVVSTISSNQRLFNITLEFHMFCIT